MSYWNSFTSTISNAASTTSSYASSALNYAGSSMIGRSASHLVSGIGYVSGLSSIYYGARRIYNSESLSDAAGGALDVIGGSASIAALHTTGSLRLASTALSFSGMLSPQSASRHLITGGLSLVSSAPSTATTAIRSLQDASNFPAYQQTYINYRKQRHQNQDLTGVSASKSLGAIHRADRVKQSGQGRTAIRLSDDFSHLTITGTENNRTVETNTMLMLESPAFQRAGESVSSKIKHQEMVLKRQVSKWKGDKRVSTHSRFIVLGGTDAPKEFSTKEWKAYRNKHFNISDPNKGNKIGRVRISRDQAQQMFSHHEQRRTLTLEKDPGQPKLFGHSLRFLTEYARLNVCQSHTRDTIDTVLGEKVTNELTRTFGFSTQGRRKLNTHSASVAKPSSKPKVE